MSSRTLPSLYPPKSSRRCLACRPKIGISSNDGRASTVPILPPRGGELDAPIERRCLITSPGCWKSGGGLRAEVLLALWAWAEVAGGGFARADLASFSFFFLPPRTH